MLLQQKLKLSVNRINRVPSLLPVKRPEEELTCAGIVIDPDVACVADAHEGTRGVNTHGVLSAVVLPFSTLVNI